MPTRDDYAEGTPNWVDLTTDDLGTARSFYAAVFGWTYQETQTDEGDLYVTAIKDGHAVAGMVPIGPAMAAGGMPSMWNTYIAVADVAVTTRAAEAAGATVMMPPTQVDDSGHMAIVVDPSGAPVALWQAGTHVGAGLVNEPGAVCWNELQTGDVGAASEFFAAIFGWTAEEQDMGEAGIYTVFHLDGKMVCGSLPSPDPDVSAHWSVVFAVEDADATAATAAAAGGTVHAQPFDTPAGRVTVIADPTGSVFQAIELDPAVG